jgi:hypothetical protein
VVLDWVSEKLGVGEERGILEYDNIAVGDNVGGPFDYLATRNYDS